MITRLTGILEAVHNGQAEVSCGDLTYSLLIPGADQQRLAARIGQSVTFHTLHYLEGQSQGAHYLPRLIGFSTPEDRAFFEVFTTVKGVGNRKALRSLQLPFGRIADAICRKDIDLLKTLPEIGKRMAETIVAELHGKVEQFATSTAMDAQRRDDRPPATRTMTDEAVAVLVTLGESKLQAMQLVDRALAADPEISATQSLIAAAYRLKALPT